jgi:small nuclear ribonucleoprotein (snRNP)-like protein
MDEREIVRAYVCLVSHVLIAPELTVRMEDGRELRGTLTAVSEEKMDAFEMFDEDATGKASAPVLIDLRGTRELVIHLRDGDRIFGGALAPGS